MRKDIQELIPASHRDLLEVVPRGFAKNAVTGALLLGAVVGAMLTRIMPERIAAAVPLTLLVIQQIWVRVSDKKFDERIKDLTGRELRWEDDEES